MTKLDSKRRTRDPQNLPITLKTAKAFLKISNTQEDDLLNSLIESTTSTFEAYTGVALITQDWQIGYRQLSTLNLSLPVKPIQQILSISLHDIKGNFASFNRNNYNLEANELSFFVFPCSYQVKINFRAGFGDDEESIPQNIKLALLNHVAYLYENRGGYRNQNTKLFEQFKGIRL